MHEALFYMLKSNIQITIKMLMKKMGKIFATHITEKELILLKHSNDLIRKNNSVEKQMKSLNKQFTKN